MKTQDAVEFTSFSVGGRGGVRRREEGERQGHRHRHRYRSGNYILMVSTYLFLTQVDCLKQAV